MSHTAEPISLEYARPTERLANLTLLRICRWISWLPSAVGILIVVLYWLTGAEALPIVGMIWLLIGGAVSFAAFCASLVFLIQAFNVTVDRSLSIRRGVVCVLLALTNIPIAVMCMMLGGFLVGQYRNFD